MLEILVGIVIAPLVWGLGAGVAHLFTLRKEIGELESQRSVLVREIRDLDLQRSALALKDAKPNALLDHVSTQLDDLLRGFSRAEFLTQDVPLKLKLFDLRHQLTVFHLDFMESLSASKLRPDFYERPGEQLEEVKQVH